MFITRSIAKAAKSASEFIEIFLIEIYDVNYKTIFSKRKNCAI